MKQVGILSRCWCELPFSAISHFKFKLLKGHCYYFTHLVAPEETLRAAAGVNSRVSTSVRGYFQEGLVTQTCAFDLVLGQIWTWLGVTSKDSSHYMPIKSKKNYAVWIILSVVWWYSFSIFDGEHLRYLWFPRREFAAPFMCAIVCCKQPFF